MSERLPINFWENKFKKGWGEGKRPDQRLLEFIEKHGDEIGPRILDIGSGGGRNLVPLAIPGREMTGLELTEKGLMMTKNKLREEGRRAELVRGDFHNLPFSNGAFDTVISVQTMMHTDWNGVEAAFAEACRVLKPNGLFFLRVKSDAAALRPEEKLANDSRGKSTKEITAGGEIVLHHLFNLEELRDLAEKNNLEIVGEPRDEKKIVDGIIEKGQWNITFRKRDEKRQRLQERAAKARWDARYENDPPDQDEPRACVPEFFEKHKKELKGGKIFDLGCGSGRNLLYAAKLGFEMYGLDISQVALSQLKNKLKEENLSADVRKGSVYNLPYKDTVFNCVMSINSLQHNDWKGAEKSFAEAGRILKDGGLFLLSVRSASRDLPEDRTDVPDKGVTFVLSRGFNAGIMLHHYTREEIEELASKNSLKILDIREDTEYKEGERQVNWIVTFRKKSPGLNSGGG
ncbi:MAG: class I SAM-dependent methyltransferase [Patescibacteria group bacterium]|nr:class I SAM-dependent methyltransferase [Patescibacteria group bacterium]